MGQRKSLLPPVSVNGVEISQERIADEAQNHPAPKNKPGLAWRSAARALALRELMLQEARARGLEPDPVELAPGKWETDDEALIRQLLEAEISAAPQDDRALRAIYDAHPERFRSPDLYQVAHILIAAPKDGPARDLARAEAETVLARVQAQPRSFGAIARDVSACESRENDGMLGQIGSGDTVPEFEAALHDMEEGALSAAPVETRYGFHIIRLDARADGKLLPFEAVLPHLREAQEKAAWVAASRAFAERLAAAAEISGVSFASAA
ncbi:MAG: peptidylprolyl isomerase [Rubellimicrobium sp.]|nr:peptidylprolyl isomerase [Rubellimicrobium sp.]